MGATPGIANLVALVDGLPPAERELFDRVFMVVTAEGEIVPPEPMVPWIERQFGSAEAVLHQRVVKVTNRLTLESAAFNNVRALRPRQEEDGEARDIDDELEQHDPFADSEAMTPADAFGRIEGRYCHTASNVAKFDALHGIVIFDEPHPLRFNREHVLDYFATARRWFEAATAYDPQAVYPLLIWNCGRKAGASLLHGHMQMVLGRGSHYGNVLRQQQAARIYRERHGSDYFGDLYRVQEALGTGLTVGSLRVLASLTPVRERETIILSPEWGQSLDEMVYETLAHFRDNLGVRAFNLGIALPPFVDRNVEWKDFPVMARLVDRGDPASTASDVAAMELFGTSVVSNDPLELAASLREWMAARR